MLLRLLADGDAEVGVRVLLRTFSHGSGPPRGDVRCRLPLATRVSELRAALRGGAGAGADAGGSGGAPAPPPLHPARPEPHEVRMISAGALLTDERLLSDCVVSGRERASAEAPVQTAADAFASSPSSAG